MNALFTLSCEKIMKSKIQIKLNELFSLMNVDLGGYSNSLKIMNIRIIKLDAILTKLDGKTYNNIIISRK